MKFRKKPVVIEAVQFDGTAASGVAVFDAFDIPNGKFLPDLANVGGTGNRLLIPTLEGELTASAGDFIIRGVKGEYYPCKPDIFAATYEAVES